MNTSPILAIFAATLAAGALDAQQWVNPNLDAHRLDFRDLGYPTQNLIPADNSRITALLTHSNGFVYGATSGRTQSYLFFYNRFINKVRPLGKIAHAVGVHHTMVEDAQGGIIIGTGLDFLEPIALTKDFPVERDGITQQLWRDISAHFADYEGGHLYRYDPRSGDVQRYTNDDPCPLEDLGIPVPKNSVYALAVSADGSRLYGISYPDAHFFEFDFVTRQTRDWGEFLTHKVYGGPERDWRSVPRALHVDPRTGFVYTSGDNGWIIRIRPGAEKPELTWMRLPGEYWEGASSSDYPVVECFDTDADGRLFAGTSDGFLVRLDLDQDRLVVLGKARDTRRIRAMKISPDGHVYLVTGAGEQLCKLHSFDLQTGGGFRNFGVVAVDRSPYYAHRGNQFEAMTVGVDGTLFLGESDRGGKLFMVLPAEPLPGDFNPANPRTDRQRPDTPGLIPENL